MDKYSGEHTLEQLFQNENIKADRFALAAISYIFKAFGDVLRSKEYWPWGSTVNFSWDNGKDNITDSYSMNKSNSYTGESVDNYIWPTSGNKSDLTRAMLCLRQAQQRSEYEETKKIKESNYRNIRDLQKRLDRLGLHNKMINKVTDNINKTTSDTEDKLNEY